jgi:hypothetical protein
MEALFVLRFGGITGRTVVRQFPVFAARKHGPPDNADKYQACAQGFQQ